MLTVCAFAFGLVGIVAAERGGELRNGSPRWRGIPTLPMLCRMVAILFTALAIACAVSGASH